MGEYVDHSHRERNHQGLDNQLLQRPPPPVSLTADVQRRERLGGLLNFYHREAAGAVGRLNAPYEVASLRVEGVSIAATARGTGHSRHTIARWLERASTAAKRFNQRLLRDVEIIELQADELCTFIGTKSRAPGLCAAIEVWSRWWAGSVLGRRASRNATAVLTDVILRGRVVGFPLIATDKFEYDVGVTERLFGSACVYGHVLKTRRNDRVVRVERRRRIGTAGRLKAARWESEDSETLNTSFVERLTRTIRQGSAYVRRRCPATPVAPTSSTGTSTSCAALTMSSGRTGRCSAVERPGRQRCKPAW